MNGLKQEPAAMANPQASPRDVYNVTIKLSDAQMKSRLPPVVKLTSRIWEGIHERTKSVSLVV